MSQEFKVRIEPHGRTVPVAPGQALLEAALAAGLNLPHSCKSGHCGSCRARLLAGTVSYPAGRPLGITREEQESGYILLCQARAQEDVAVEARLIANVDDVEIKTLPCRIARRVMLAPDVMQVWLRLPAVERLHFQPGQYLDVLLEGGTAAQLLHRQSAARQRAAGAARAAASAAGDSPGSCSAPPRPATRRSPTARCCGSRVRSASSPTAPARRRC